MSRQELQAFTEIKHKTAGIHQISCLVKVPDGKKVVANGTYGLSVEVPLESPPLELPHEKF